MQERLNSVLKNIKDAKDRSSNNQIHPKLIAVSKRQNQEKIRQLFSLGVSEFAENYWQEAREKMAQLSDLDIIWHFIGTLQSKKIKEIVGRFDYIQSLDRLELAIKISKIATQKGIVQKVLVQVNIAEELSKSGLAPHQVLNFIEQVKTLENIEISGLMIFPPLSENEDVARQWFQKGFNLFGAVKESMGESFKYLSMGTSSDYSMAVEEGATMLRVGESLMGPRAIGVL